jgi:hypothetical protein
MRLLTTSAMAALLACAAPAAEAQLTKTLTGEMTTVTATVEAIEQSSREVTLKKSDGTYSVVQVPTGVKRFDTLKVGDKITAKYYDNIVLRLKAPGEPDTDTVSAAKTKAAQGKAGTAAAQRTITATITAIDRAAPSITFTGPNNWTYSSRVQDIKALEKVKVGDRLDITWTAAMLLSFEGDK